MAVSCNTFPAGDWPPCDNPWAASISPRSGGVTSSGAAACGISSDEFNITESQPYLNQAPVFPPSPPASSMTTENAIYQYEPLTNRHEIRVLYLTSGGSDEPLSGHLRLEQLGAVSYEALSYEWGNAEKNHIFHIHDGRTLRITESLHNALRDLRRGPPRSQAPRATWADGICINQDDISERGQ